MCIRDRREAIIAKNLGHNGLIALPKLEESRVLNIVGATMATLSMVAPTIRPGKKSCILDN